MRQAKRWPGPNILYGVHALTPEQRTARRKIFGTLNLENGMWFEPTGEFCIWRDDHASTEWTAGIPELSMHFEVLLQIPCSVQVEMANVR